MSGLERESSQRIVRVEHAPPENELPVVLAPGISWSGAGVVFAIPALLMYSAGFELLIMFRSVRQQVVAAEDRSDADARRRHAQAVTSHARDIGEKLKGLRVNGRSVEQLGEQFHDHGFNGRVWVPAGALVDGDQIFTLDWPGIENIEQQLARATIAGALARVTTLW